MARLIGSARGEAAADPSPSAPEDVPTDDPGVDEEEAAGGSPSSGWVHEFIKRARTDRAAEAAADAATMALTEDDEANLRDLYRAAAKHVHPDTADTDEERQRRTTVMAALNDAYERGDAQAIQRILDDEAMRPGPISDQDIQRRLAITQRKIARVRVRLKELRRWRDGQVFTPYWIRYQISCDEREAGRDYLADQEAAVRARLDLAKARLAALQLASASGVKEIPLSLRDDPQDPQDRLWACPIHHSVRRTLAREAFQVRRCARPLCGSFDTSLQGW